ncbi:MAG TPA: ribose-5-phosphate isomerase RpiA [Luteitalea sp.]|nr:ribose-5-phosphate isomerase RpiA [Luteitalea sp.]
MNDREREKALAAQAAMQFVADGMVIGLGTGSTAEHAIRLLGGLVRDGLRVSGVPTSERTAALARAEGIPLLLPERGPTIDLTIDGADEVLVNGDAIKGAGGALVREKIVATASRHVVFIVDSSKLVASLGAQPLPVEVVEFGHAFVARQLEDLGFAVTMRASRDGGPYRSENGNPILDARLRSGRALPDDATLRGIAGVVEHGLFRAIARHVVVGRGHTTEIYEKSEVRTGRL